MKKISQQQPWLLGLGLAIGVTALLLVAAPNTPVSTIASRQTEKGGPRLVKIEALPEMNAAGEMCQFMPASASSQETLLAMAQARGQAAGQLPPRIPAT